MPLPSLHTGAKAVTTSSTWAHSKASCPCSLLNVGKEQHQVCGLRSVSVGHNCCRTQ